MEKLEEIFAELGLNRSNGLFITKENLWKGDISFPNRVKRLIERKIFPDAFFCFDNKPLILFFHTPSNRADLHKAIWNFNECPVAIIVQNDLVEIFNGFNYLKDNDTLEKLGGKDELNNFTYLELVTGRTWEKYEDQLNYKNRVDYHLLENIKSARRLLVEQRHLDAKIANAIIGKCIFARYLIDRKVKMKFDDKLRTWNNSEFCELLNNPKQIRSFFDYLEDTERGFNGDLFPLSSAEYKKITKDHFQVLRKLLQGVDIDKNQPSLFELYDFSIIPIEFISNVYELFIGQDNQKNEGAYYTPLFLVDYILKETVEKHLNNINKLEATVNEVLSRQSGNHSYCKVLDPACGSGIFLVETLRKIIEKYIDHTGIEIKSDRFKTAIKNLARENIYGIDKDESAVQVAIFSIYLTLLDYLEPPGIETFKFPVLLNSNFFQADFFDTESPFNNQLKKLEFDFILGNPPWGGNAMKEVGKKYVAKRRKEEVKANKKYEIAINNNEIVEGFILRVSDFSKVKTNIAFIVRSTILYNQGYNDGYSKFRQYWLEEFFVKRVFELAPVRHEVFDRSNDPSIAPAAILFYSYANGQDTSNNVIEHIALKQSRFFSLFKVFTINRTDFKKIQQKKLKDFDWLWKVLVYGSYLDFNFIKRLRNDYKSIKQIVSNESSYAFSSGFHSQKNPLTNPLNTSELKNKLFIKSDAVSPFFIDFSKTDKFEPSKVDRVRDTRIYNAPVLLIRNGLDTRTLNARAAISQIDIIYKNALFGIKPLKGKSNNVLRNILGILHSDLYSYLAINTFCSIGIEREQTKEYEKLNVPYVESVEIEKLVISIENNKKKINTEINKDFQNDFLIKKIQKDTDELIKQVGESIFRNLQIAENDEEQSLIDYSLSVNRVLINSDDLKRKQLFSVFNIYDTSLEAYATLFLNRFKSNLETTDKRFIVEIWHTGQIIGMFFKMIPIEKYSKDIIWVDKQRDNVEILSFLIKLSSEKITDRLFIQKDIRGFEKHDFYIFKPNERRLWHKAIGYLDVSEFADAILKAGRDGK